ncbi:membrane protein [Caballeronia novacaledonica]|uniref:Membrane protein n=1 Tax=Caballeronia novacaledonica TaxID=1544861 RepID=A0A2U3I7A0_9BURK|nr:glycine zipper domain-containing protein [Caballeronia novacaledonica]SPB15998.1 membrane protein [Caballeronia novacaledonica]
MSLIIAGRFQTFPAAETAAQKLFARGFVEEDVTLFFVNPSGQHARYPVGGDVGTDAGARAAPKGAGKGVTIGAVVGAVVGAAIFAVFHAPLLVSVIAAGVGAYVGSLAGAMSHTKKPQDALHAEEPARHAGVLVAVHVSPESQDQAASALREAGGMDIERASGRWKQGRWSDFDPLQPPHPLGEFAHTRA